jgi:muconolactone delta-isomerase
MLIHAASRLSGDSAARDRLREAEIRTNRELTAEGVILQSWRSEDRTKVFLILEADDVDVARSTLRRLPFVEYGVLVDFVFDEVVAL